MLVLSRKENQVICIGDDIRITVIRSGGLGKVRLGIEAPPDIPVHREEVKQRIDEAKGGEG